MILPRIRSALNLRRIGSLRRPLGLLFLALVIVLPLGIYAPVSLPRDLFSPKARTLRVEDRAGVLLAEIPSDSARSQQSLRLQAMGNILPKVTVALEDHRFYEHNGIDFYAIIAAAVRNLSQPRFISGASTITQQTIKLASGRKGRRIESKAYEAIAAVKLEHRWTKGRILEEYLNRTHYGNRLIGPEAASVAYFGKKAAELDWNEAIFLAGLPQAPSRFNPWKHYESAKAKYLRSVDRLQLLGVLDAKQAASLKASCPKVERNLPPRRAPHFVDAIVSQYPERAGKLRTTLDWELQKALERMVETRLPELEGRGVGNVAVVVMENDTGSVRGMIGSGSYRKSQINGALVPRSCGSTLKPFVYLMGLDQRKFTASTILPDTPDAARNEFFDYDPQNYTRRHFGPVRLRDALASSLNVPAVVAVSRLGARGVFYDLQKWGFEFHRTLGDYGAGFILGNAEIRLLDLAAAYAALARGGIRVHPAFLEEQRTGGNRLASAEAVSIITDILADNNARRLSFSRISPLTTGDRVAVKTGTSSGFRDALTVGFTRDHTVAVWAGNFDGRPMQELPAIRAAAPLWRQIIDYLLVEGDRALPPMEENDRLKRVQICDITGELPVYGFSPYPQQEWFLAGTEPSGSAAAQFTIIAGRPRLMLPVEYTAWCRSPENFLGAIVAPTYALKVTQPREKAVFQLDPILSRQQQRVELVATTPPNQPVHWYVNGEPVNPGPDGRFFWELQPGEVEAVVVSNGETATSRFEVKN